MPEDFQFNGQQIADFCVRCSPLQVDIQGQQGSAMEFVNCGLPIKVNVVGARTRENIPKLPSVEPEKKSIELPTTPFYYFMIILILLIALIIWYKRDKTKNHDF